jgi:hypothetical protein
VIEVREVLRLRLAGRGEVYEAAFMHLNVSATEGAFHWIVHRTAATKT